MKIAIAIVWVICGFINWGITLGSFSHHYPWGNNQGIAGMMAICGVPALPVTLLFGAPYHWPLKPYTTEQRWEAFHKRWPSLSREYFEQEYN